MWYWIDMPAKINPIKKALLKKNLYAGQSAIEAQKNAGYSDSYAHSSTNNACVKICIQEIEKDIKKQITVESVLKSLEKIKALSIAAKDYSTATRCDELCGRWLAMWRDRLEIVPVEAVDGQFSVSRLTRMRAIPVSGGDITPQPDER